MCKQRLLIVLLAVCLLLAGCQNEIIYYTPDIEPSAAYDWMAGESPVPEKRIGLFRAGVADRCIAVGPKGLYFYDKPMQGDSYILYVDNGSDTVVKLCGRADCNHDTNDCNAYVEEGMMISYYGGYVYAASGNGGFGRSCSLFRIKPDGTDRMVALDIQSFAEEQGADFGQCDLMTDGYCIFSTHRWEQVKENEMQSVRIAFYLYKLDGSMKEPVKLENFGFLYQCGDALLAYSGESCRGGEYGSYWDLDLETDTKHYLTDHPGVPGWFGPEQAFYFRDGAVYRLSYDTQTEEAILRTDLEGKYYAFMFPDCIVLASRESGEDTDNCLYIYNWNFELVDTVTIYNPNNRSPDLLLVGETAERLILTDDTAEAPRYYINKSELGTGNAKVHTFVMPI